MGIKRSQPFENKDLFDIWRRQIILLIWYGDFWHLKNRHTLLLLLTDLLVCLITTLPKVWRDLKTNPKDPSLREMAKFAKYILAKFLKVIYLDLIQSLTSRQVAESNKKVFMELLFWKTSREAVEIFDGYGTQVDNSCYAS